MVRIRTAGLTLDAALAGTLVVLVLGFPPRGTDGYFDIRGAEAGGVYATYVGTTRRGFDAWLAVTAAMREGGYGNFSGKLIYATSKYFILYDPIRNDTVILSDDFTYRFVDGIPVRTKIYPKREDGYDLAALGPESPTGEVEAREIARMCSALREVGALECFVLADSGFLADRGAIPGSLVTDVLAGWRGAFLVRTAGREAVVSYTFSPIRSVVGAEDAVREIVSGEYGLIDHRFSVSLVLVLIRHDADLDAVERLALEHGMRLIEVRRSC